MPPATGATPISSSMWPTDTVPALTAARHRLATPTSVPRICSWPERCSAGLSKSPGMTVIWTCWSSLLSMAASSRKAGSSGTAVRRISSGAGVTVSRPFAFVAILGVGLIYVWKKGDMDWVKSMSAEAREPRFPTRAPTTGGADGDGGENKEVA